MENSEKKLHIDEDWKTQVEREKEAAKSRAGAAGSTSAPHFADQGAAAESPTLSGEEAARQRAQAVTGEEQPYGEPAGEHPPSSERGKRESLDYKLPPPTLSFLITTLGTQAMVALGEVPNPITGKLERLPQQAKHFIDTLAMLEEKTEGNRAPEESAILRSLLHQLRMAYVARQS
jgi:hypothetical protein